MDSYVSLEHKRKMKYKQSRQTEQREKLFPGANGYFNN